ncbi:MAG: hypothetical protein ABEJ56_02110 [Candidatus Nanohaloarchaea archaeon]
MRIGVDFDRVLFDTDEFSEHLEQEFPGFSESYDEAYENGYYNLERHAELLGLNEEEILDALEDCDRFVFDRVEDFEKLGQNHELVIVTRGDPVFQKEKLQKSGVLNLFDNYVIVQEESKNVEGIEFLVDDREEEIERIDIPGLAIEKGDLETVFEHLLEPDFEQVFRRYDIRGRYPSELNEYFAYRLGRSVAAFAEEEGVEKVVVGRDTKESSRNLKKCLEYGLKNSGISVLDIGTGPTDYVAYSAKKKDAIGVQVTSSHLPLEFNGFKLLYPEGNGFLNSDLDRVKDIFGQEDFSDGKAEIKNISGNLEEKYRSKVKGFVEGFNTDFDKKIAVDTLGGAAYSFLEQLLHELGAEVVQVSGSSGPRIDPPDPKPDNLEELVEKVEEREADLGIATDMDGDRLSVFDGEEFVPGDDLLSVFAQLFDGDVVASVDTSEALENTIGGGRKVFYTRVGDPFVMDMALEKEVEFAGEPNGHYAFPEFVPYHSGTLAGLIAAGVDLDEMRENVPEYYTLNESVEVEDKEGKMSRFKQEVESQFEFVSEVDGIKFRSLGSTALVRPSGSSPKLRLKVESEHEKKAEEVMSGIRDIVRNA